MNDDSTYHKLLFTILLAAFAIRLIGINQPINEDELHWAYAAETKEWLGTITRNTPLSFYAMNSVTALLGTEIWAIRLTFVLAGLATILVTAKLAKELYGKKTALISAALLAIHPMHALASLQAAYEGSFLTLFFATSIYFLHRYSRTNEEKNVYLVGLAFGLATLSKISAILLIPPIAFIYILASTKKITTAISKTAKVIAIGTSLFIFAFALPSILAKSPALINAITQLLSQTEATRTSIIPLIFQYGYAIIWLGPMLICLPAYAIFKKKTDKLNLVAIIYVVSFYLFAIRESAPPIERYWMILLPSLAILSAQTTKEIIADKKHIILAITSAIIALILLIIINLRESKIINFYPKTAYIEQVLLLKWNFLVPITGSSGPLGFYINAIAIILPFIAVFLLLIISAIARRETTTKIIWAILLGISISYSAFFAQEYLVSSTHPNTPLITQQIIDYANQNKLSTPIYYFKNYALLFHFNEAYKKNHVSTLPKFDYFNYSAYNQKNFEQSRKKAFEQPLYKEFIPISFVDDTEEKSNKLSADIKKQGGTMIVIDFPQLSKTGPLWKTINKCKQTKTFSNKNLTLGYVFDCAENKVT